MSNRTIVALATGKINCAIHIIRVSGDQVYEIVSKICSKKIKKIGYTIERNTIVENKKIIDNVILVKYVTPKSFTGEDLIEINCHGGIFLANKIISLLIKNGCSLALCGEFSKIAFLNNKININQATAINNLIEANSDKAILIANNGISEKTRNILNQIKDEMFMIIGQIEVNIDYPEYDDVPKLTNKEIVDLLKKIQERLNEIISVSKIGLKYLQGINICILGKPNVGKSTLMNLLTNNERAIVSNIAGTTRDIIETKITIDGVNINLFDTAGIRKNPDNTIEEIGIKKALELLKDIDLILLLFDGSSQLDNDDFETINLVKTAKKQYINIINKADLKTVKNNLENPIYISAANKQITNLIEKIKSFLPNLQIDDNSILLQSTHLVSLIEKIVNNIQEIIRFIENKTTIDIVMQLFQQTYLDFLKVCSCEEDYDFINELFSKFCLGK